MATRATAATAAQDEAAESPYVYFTYDGDEYTVEKSKLEDLDVLEAFEAEKLLTPLKLILGDTQWALFRKRHNGAKELGDLAQSMYKALGVSLGE